MARSSASQIEGVIAPETAAHAAGTSALLPMLTLGIPGRRPPALLGGLLIWGLQPGPLLFVEARLRLGFVASMYLGNIAGLIIVLTTVPWWAAILRFRSRSSHRSSSSSARSAYTVTTTCSMST
jgi:putative tricarboxylic transport membrane protein